jgi:hypothetical protein
MTLPRIVAITGHARHGKDTCADYLASVYGYTRYALATPLKESVCVMFGWSPEQVEGPTKELVDHRWGLSPRQALQALGTEYGQSCLCGMFPEFRLTTGRKLWVRRLLDRAGGDPRIVISDCRFPHEAEEIRRAGGVVIRVTRPGYPVDLSHESERAVDEIHPDAVVSNMGSIEDLYAVLDKAMEIFKDEP